jgi:hypothetical protein
MAEERLRFSGYILMSRDAIQAFERVLGKSAVLTSAADCLAYGFDNSSYRANPAMVLLPETAEQPWCAWRVNTNWPSPHVAAAPTPPVPVCRLNTV